MLESKIQEIEDKLAKLCDSGGIDFDKVNELLDKLEEVYAEMYNGPRILD